MNLNLRQNCKYNLAVPTSMGVRITPVDYGMVQNSNMYRMQATSAETNVLNVSASLGKNTLALTTFVKDSPIASFIKGELRRRNINYLGVDVPQGGPWGYRHQFNIADTGYGLRGPRVCNDRSGEVGQTLNINDFDLNQIFNVDGVQVLHISGLIAAISENTSNFCVELAKFAKKSGTIISFDLNYRASFWQGRKESLRTAFTKIAELSDILIGNEEDFQLALGINGPVVGGENINIEEFKELMTCVRKAFPNVKVFCDTLRVVKNVNEHYWGALTSFNDEVMVIEPRPIPVLDRIGGGDGFVGGFLYGVICGFDLEKATQFGWATGVLAASSLDDAATCADEEQVWNIWKGNARVKR